ncbi:MAG TPA: gamma carbonic anhydrase family protein [Anaeromyxobacteraceae bacterium]|nr:gamma carbonic anhydrase family protein [Anaeromyxobacteraceae bacterium]
MPIIRPFGGRAPVVPASAFVAKGAVVVGDVELGEHSSIWFGCVLRGDVNQIRIGARTNVQDLTTLHVTSRTHPTVVGDEVTIGHRVVLHGCTIKERCLVGIGSVVLDGAVVGPEAVIGAGALVPPGMVVPPRTLVMGSPAKVKRDLSPAEIEALQRSAENYVEYAARYVAEGWTSR